MCRPQILDEKQLWYALSTEFKDSHSIGTEPSLERLFQYCFCMFLKRVQEVSVTNQEKSPLRLLWVQLRIWFLPYSGPKAESKAQDLSFKEPNGAAKA